jgi:hypothetical protein
MSLLRSVKRVLDTRSRAEPPNRNILGQALRDDKASGFRASLRDDTASCHLTMLLVRITVLREKWDRR